MPFPVTLNGRTYTLADFEGTNYVDGLPDAFEDFVTQAGDIYNSTSTSSVAIGTGSKTFTTADSGKPYQAGTPLRIADAAAPSTNFMDCIVTSYSGTTLVVDVVGTAGSGTKSSWTINIGGTILASGGTFVGDSLSVSGTATIGGNAGIGTNTPDKPLDVVSGTGNSDVAAFTGLNTGRGLVISTFNAASDDAGVDLAAISGQGVLTLSTASSERVRIDSLGNVGIGTNDPAANLEISSDANTKIRISDSTSVNQRFEISHNAGFTALTAGNNAAKGVIAFYQFDGTNTTEAMRIDPAGRIALGNVADSDAGLSTTDAVTIIGKSIGGGHSSSIRFHDNDDFGPSVCAGSITCVDTFGGGGDFSPFDSAGQMQISAAAGGVLLADNASTLNGYPAGAVHLSGGITKAYRRTTTTSHPVLQVASDVGTGSLLTKWQVTANGTAATTSDQRLKENIADAADAGSAIDAMQVRQFDWKGSDKTQSYGFVAQELHTVFPEAVVEGGANESTDPWGVDYAALVPMLVKEIQSLRARVAQLEAN